jgi:hypothetical protein
LNAPVVPVRVTRLEMSDIAVGIAIKGFFRMPDSHNGVSFAALGREGSRIIDILIFEGAQDREVLRGKDGGVFRFVAGVPGKGDRYLEGDLATTRAAFGNAGVWSSGRNPERIRGRSGAGAFRP